MLSPHAAPGLIPERDDLPLGDISNNVDSTNVTKHPGWAPYQRHIRGSSMRVRTSG